jgi:hypothetical protein
MADKRRMNAKEWSGSGRALPQPEGPDLAILIGGPGWDRTSDLPRVKRTLSH